MPSANRFQALKGSRKGGCSISINDPWAPASHELPFFRDLAYFPIDFGSEITAKWLSYARKSPGDTDDATDANSCATPLGSPDIERRAGSACTGTGRHACTGDP